MSAGETPDPAALATGLPPAVMKLKCGSWDTLSLRMRPRADGSSTLIITHDTPLRNASSSMSTIEGAIRLQFMQAGRKNSITTGLPFMSTGGVA